MATKVHDQDDQDFAEIDVILAQAKRELHRDRCRDRKLRRNMNLSDIPENFAHVPSLSILSEALDTRSHSRSASLDTSQPDFASRDRAFRQSKRPQGHHPKLLVLGMMAPMKWLRAYMSCVMAVHDVDVGSTTGSQHAFAPATHLASRQPVGSYAL